MRNLNICIAGLGNVGANLINTIVENNSFVTSKASISFNIIGISAKNRNKKRICNIDPYEWFDDSMELVNTKGCDVIIELIGEEKGISFSLVKKALENKINVITANKALLAKNGTELFQIAEKNNVLLLFEAAVAGGIPIIKTIKNNIFLDKIKKISGILNGTTNYILTKMEEESLDFHDALSVAKTKGYTNDNESELDVGGIDSAHKLTLLTSLCFGSEINFSNTNITGISDIRINDIFYASKLGYKIKLISEAYIVDNNIFSITSPKLINKTNSLANVNGVLNAINIETDQLKSLFLEGEGAGGKATSSSVISDLYEIISKTNILSLGYKTNQLKKFKKINALEIKLQFFLRIMAKDVPGVLSKITTSLNDSGISIKKFLQLPDNNKLNLPIPIIIITHEIKKELLMKALDKIQTQDFVLEKISIIPIDNN
jgi:homoserine dehydrogenase